MCDCKDIELNTNKWTIKPWDVLSDPKTYGTETNTSESCISVVSVDELKDEAPIGLDVFWLVDRGDGVLYKVKEFKGTTAILEDEPFTTENKVVKV